MDYEGIPFYFFLIAHDHSFESPDDRNHVAIFVDYFLYFQDKSTISKDDKQWWDRFLMDGNIISV